MPGNKRSPEIPEIPDITENDVLIQDENSEAEIAREDALLAELLSAETGRQGMVGGAFAAQRFRASRVRESGSMRALLGTVRSDSSSWERVSGFLGRARSGDYTETTPGNRRNRVMTPLFAGIYAANPRLLDTALQAAVEEDASKLQSGQFWPTIVVGSGPSSSVFVSQRRESVPGEALLTIDEAAGLGGQFATAKRPLFRLNSRNRPTLAGEPAPLPGDKGGLNSLSPGVIEVADLDSTVYPTQNVLAVASGLNTYLNSSLVATKTRLMGIIPNRRADSAGRYRLLTERDGRRIELTTDKLVIGSGLGKESYKLGNKDSDAFIDRERQAEKPRVMTYDDFLARVGDPSRQFPLADFAGKTVAVVGAGDSAKTVIETLLNLQVQSGDSVAQIDQVDKIQWWGQTSTTKEALCQDLRARYNLIALNAPRSNQTSFEARLDIIEQKVRTIKEDEENSARLCLEGAVTFSRTPDIAILAKGYESELEDVLSTIAKPTDIDGGLINGNQKAQEQLASGLKPGSCIILEAGASGQTFIELLPAGNDQLTLRYTIGNQVIDRTYGADNSSEAILKILASGKVASVQAIGKGEMVASGDAVTLYEKGQGTEALRDFFREAQAQNRIVWALTRQEIRSIPVSITEDRTVRTFVQRGGSIDFFTVQRSSADSSLESSENLLALLDGVSTYTTISLPVAKPYDSLENQRLFNLLRPGVGEELREYVVPGFGITIQTSSEFLVYIVTDVQDDMVSFIDRSRSFEGRGVEIFEKSYEDFVGLLVRAYRTQGGNRYTAVARLVDTTVKALEEGRPETRTETRANKPYLSERVTELENLLGFIRTEQAAGNEIIVFDPANTVIRTLRELPDDTDTNVDARLVSTINARSEAFDFAEQSVDETYAYALVRSYAQDPDAFAVSVPKAEVGVEISQRFKQYLRDEDTAARRALNASIQPGFGISYKTRVDERRVNLVLERNGDTITLIDSSNFAGFDDNGYRLPLFTLQTRTVNEYISDLSDKYERQGGREYAISFRIPNEASRREDTTPSTLSRRRPANPGQPIKIPRSKLILSDVTADLMGESTALAKSVLGEDIYIIGPAAQLPLSNREAARLQQINVTENNVAIFRYTPRNRRLAELLSARVGYIDQTVSDFRQPITIGNSTKKMTRYGLATTASSSIPQLPYDIDSAEIAAYALVASLQSRIATLGKDYSFEIGALGVQVAGGKEDIIYEFTGTGMTRTSTEALGTAITESELFRAAFDKLTLAAPGGYKKVVSFDITPNGVNPYSVVIRNVRLKKM
ncbi:MAG: hypothetical protein JWN38_304 [Candidatus Saccharibacteria bacterium]|nr:hypothetical protein [Candidatus Saccharibacteria bacterium]